MIRLRPAAAKELAADVRYYDRAYPGRGQRFLLAVEKTLDRIDAAPLRPPILIAPDIRSAKVERFPYRVVYLVIDDVIDVVAVAHAKRRPMYWRRRTR
ncbi:MAG TPA: type II toxin-antitoxin system RelE/ParE family toxin [Kofleriaceae bacterium]|jgi:toxin ParE1/3/4